VPAWDVTEQNKISPCTHGHKFAATILNHIITKVYHRTGKKMKWAIIMTHKLNILTFNIWPFKCQISAVAKHYSI
jgi:hypothetical protein